ncbi:MAG: hypothetical protein LBI68_10035 [Azoarcus sp.]|jgi:hypothetical protein|nr:hypothetical protein [Azoarcus sp.]
MCKKPDDVQIKDFYLILGGVKRYPRLDPVNLTAALWTGRPDVEAYCREYLSKNWDTTSTENV